MSAASREAAAAAPAAAPAQAVAAAQPNRDELARRLMRRLVIEFKGSSKEVQRGLAVDYRAVVQSVQRYYKQPESCPLPLGKLVALMVAMLKRIAEKRKDYNERDVTVLGDSMSPERAGKGARAAGPRAQQQQHPAPSGARRVLLPPGGAQAGGDGAGAAAAAPPASRTPSPPPVVMGRAARGPHPALRRRRGAEGGAGDLTFDGQGWTTLCLDDDAMFAAHPMRGGKAAATAATKSKNAASAAAAAAPAAGIPAGDDELMLVESPESIPADSPKTTFVRLQRLLNESAYGGEAQVVPALQLSHHAGAGEGGAQHGTPHKEATAEPASNALADGSATATAGEGTESTHAEEAASERQVKEDSPEVDLFSPRRRARHVGSSLTKRIKRRVVTPKMRPVAAPLPESITAVLDSGSASKRKRGSAAPPAGVLLEVPSAGTCAYPFTPPTEATAPPSDTDGTAKCLAAQAPYVLQPATASSLSSSSSHSPIVVNAVASGTPGSGDAVSFGSTPGASPYGALAAAVTAVATVATAPAATRAGKDVASKGAAVGDGDGVPTVITSPDAHPVAATALQTPPRTSPASASASTPRDITSPQSSRGGSTGRTARKRRRADDPPLLGLLGPGGGGSGVKIRKTDKRAGHMPPLLGLFGPAGTPPTMAQANAALPRNPAVWVEGIIPPEDARAGRKPTPLFPEDPAAAALLEGGNPATGVPAITVTAVPAPPQPPLAVKCPIPAPASTATSAAAATTTTPVAAPAAAAQKKALSPLSLPQPPPGAAAVGRLPLPRPPAAPRGGPPGGADANAAAVPGTAACPLVLDGGPASPGKPGGYLGIPGGLAVGAKRKAPASPMDGGLGGGTPLLVPSPGKPLSLDPSGKRRKVIGTGEYSAFTPFGTPRMSPLAAPGTAPLTATTLPEHQDQEMFDTLDPPSFPRIPNVTVVAAPLANFDGRFALHDERQWKTFLLRRGWVIIKDMATTLECEDLISGFWDARATMKTGVSRKDAKTWSNDRWGGNLLTGEWTNDGAGQEPWVWEAREKCAPVFESIYKTNELVTSFDGFEAWRPGYVTKPTAWHVDQAVTNPHFQCIQGFLNLIESGPNDGGFCVASSSKKRFSTLATDCGLHEAKRYQVIPSAAQRHVIGAAFKLNVKQGDFVLFDSRTIHCTQPCPPAHLKQKTHCGLVRLCVNICMLPISLLAKNTADPTVLPAAQAQVRRQAIEEGKTFSHHPGWLCQPPGQRAEGHSKRYHSQALAAYTPPTLNHRMLCLAGLAPYNAPPPAVLPYSTETRNLMPLRAATPILGPRGTPVKVEPHREGETVSLLDDLCGDSDSDHSDVQIISPKAQDRPERLDRHAGAGSDATENLVHVFWDRLTLDLELHFARSYSTSPRRAHPTHLQLLTAAGVTGHMKDEIKSAARDTVVELWNAATTYVMQKRAKKQKDKVKGKVQKVRVEPLLQEINILVKHKLDGVVEMSEADDALVAKIIEARLRKKHAASATLPPNPLNSPFVSSNDVGAMMFREDVVSLSDMTNKP